MGWSRRNARARMLTAAQPEFAPVEIDKAPALPAPPEGPNTDSDNFGLMKEDDITAYSHGDIVSLETLPEDNIRREVQGFRIVKRAIAQVAPLLLSPKLPRPALAS